MAVRMDLDPVSQTPGPWPGPVIASSAPARPAKRRSCCERPARASGDAEAQALLARTWNSRSRTRPSARAHGHQHGGLVAGVLPGQPP